MILTTLLEQWRTRAETLREFGMDTRGAELWDRAADELEASAQHSLMEPLPLEVAEVESGYTRGHLRREIRDGRLPNAGSEKEPRILRCNLPRKPGHAVASPGTRIAESRVQVARAVASGE